MKIDDAIKMLEEVKKQGSDNIIFAFWTADAFTKINDKSNLKTFTEGEVWKNIAEFIDNNMDWAYTHEALQEIIYDWQVLKMDDGSISDI